MANDEHVAMLKQGVATWNAWRDENPYIRPDLSGANLHRASLEGGALHAAHLNGADLGRAHLSAANLSGADLSEAYRRNANLGGADLSRANLSLADLKGADLVRATLVDTNLTGADLTDCRIYGVSAWRVKLEKAKQQNLVITRADEPDITVDNIEVAQFIYLMFHNEKIRKCVPGYSSVILTTSI
jgi:Pentapeptide repeats (8 copies)